MTIYKIDLWGSHPTNGNDDCWSGDDYQTESEARQAFAEALSDDATYDTAYVVLEGPDGLFEALPHPSHDPARVAAEVAADDAAWRREIATQHGMAFGCDGYNEVMGN